MSYVELREEIDLYEYYILLAKALEAEEREQYNLATLVSIGVNAPKRLRRWKWRYSDDHNRREVIKGNTPMDTMAAFAASKLGALKPLGSGLTFAKATGRPYAFMDKDGRLFDENGEPVERVPGMVIIRIDDTPQ